MWCFLVTLKSKRTVGKRRSWPPLLMNVVVSRLGSPVAFENGIALRMLANKPLIVGSGVENASPLTPVVPTAAALAITSVEQRKADGEPAGAVAHVVFRAGFGSARLATS